MKSEEIKKLLYMLHPIERKILPYLKRDLCSLDVIAQESGLELAETTTAVQLLEQRELTLLIKEEKDYIILDEHGKKAIETDLPETLILKEILNTSKSLSSLSQVISQSQVSSAMGELKKNQYATIEKKEELNFTITEKGKEFLKHYTNPLLQFKQGIEKSTLTEEQQQIVQQFLKRKGFLKEKKEKRFLVALTDKGSELQVYYQKEFNSNLELLETLSTQDLKTGSWKNKEFRHYDIHVPTSFPQIGRKHPMLEANEVLSKIFLEMGFQEMKGPMVESAFWNMDVMWIPQDHPARDEQDTFYLEDSCEIPEELFEKVKEMHEQGLKLTHTPKGEFSKEISQKQLLRTHSTATSFRVLYELGKKQQQGENINGKYFYLANVFRNEAVDATHLAEFYQGEGFIIGDDLSLADLMGFVKEYLNKLGFEKIKFKPTFNPYTEPSMEAHIYDEEIGKWYALINSGIFRAETLAPLGLENKRIIAWGFGASRIAAKLAKKLSMRDITGATCDFEWLKTREQMQPKVTIIKNGGEN